MLSSRNSKTGKNSVGKIHSIDVLALTCCRCRSGNIGGGAEPEHQFPHTGVLTKNTLESLRSVASGLAARGPAARGPSITKRCTTTVTGGSCDSTASARLFH